MNNLESIAHGGRDERVEKCIKNDSQNEGGHLSLIVVCK